MTSPVSFGRKPQVESYADIDKPAQSHKIAKVVTSVAIGAGVVTAGLVVGHKTGAFKKASEKLLGRALSSLPFVKDYVAKSKISVLKNKANAFMSSAFSKLSTGFTHLDKAGETVDKYANKALLGVLKKIFKKSPKAE